MLKRIKHKIKVYFTQDHTEYFSVGELKTIAEEPSTICLIEVLDNKIHIYGCFDKKLCTMNLDDRLPYILKNKRKLKLDLIIECNCHNYQIFYLREENE